MATFVVLDQITGNLGLNADSITALTEDEELTDRVRMTYLKGNEEHVAYVRGTVASVADEINRQIKAIG